MAEDVSQERIRRVLVGVMEPLARTLLRCGVGYTEFAELSKQAFVNAASEEHGVRDRPINTARISVMTGLSRKEVGRIRKEIRGNAGRRHVNVTLPAAILEAWHINKKFRDKAGTPKILPFGGSGVSFTSLVRSVSSDTPPGALRQELLRAGAVRSVSRGHLVPVRRHFIPDSAGERLLVGLELGLRRLTETIAFNSDQEKAGPMRFQRFIEGPAIDQAELETVRDGLLPLLHRFSLSIDDFLAATAPLRSRRRSRRQRPVTVGVGIYYFDDTSK